MPELGKATYVVTVDSRQGEVAISGLEARADAASKDIQRSMGMAEKSVSTLGVTAEGTAGSVDTSTTAMAAGFQEAGAAATTMGTEVEAGAAKAAAASRAAAMATTTAWSRAGASFKKFGQGMKHAGHSLTHKVTLPAALIAGVAIKEQMDYSEKISLLQTQAGASIGETSRKYKELLALSQRKDITQGPEALADAMFHLESVGLRQKEATKFQIQASHLATLGNASLEDSTNALATAYKVKLIPAQGGVARAAGIINAAIGAGNMRMPEFIEAMKTGLPDALKFAGLGLVDGASALALFTARGIPAVKGATFLRMSLFSLKKPTDAQSAALAKMGFTNLKVAESFRKQGLIKTIDMLSKAYENFKRKHGKDEADKTFLGAFGGVKSGQGMLDLIMGHKQLAQTQDQIKKKAQDMPHLLAHALNEPVNKMRKTLANLQADLIRLGEILVPIFLKLADALKRAANWFDKLNPQTKKWVLIGIGLLAVLGPILGMVGSLIVIISALTLPILAVIAAIALLAIAFIYLYRKHAGFRKAVAVTAKFVIQHWRAIGFAIMAVVAPGILAAALIIKHWNRVWRWMRAFAHNFARNWRHPIALVVNLFHLGVQAIKGAFGILPAEIQRIMAAVVNYVISGLNDIIDKINSVASKVPGVHDIGHIGEVNWGKRGPQAADPHAGMTPIKDKHGKIVGWSQPSVHAGQRPIKDKRGNIVGWVDERGGPHKRKRHKGKHTGGAPFNDYPDAGSFDEPDNLGSLLPGYNADGTPKDSKKKKKKKHHGTTSAAGAALLGPEWMKLEDRYLKAQTTKRKSDDRVALIHEQRYLERLLKRPGLKEKKRHEALQALVSVKHHLASIDKTTKDTKALTAKQVSAMIEMKGSFFDQFASNIFHRNAEGKLEMGSTKKGKPHHAHITQNNHYNEIPKDRFRHARQMRKAAQAANE